MSLEKTLFGTFPCLVVLASSSKLSHISIKLQADSNILASPEAGRGNCPPYVLTFLRVRRINRDKIKICPPYQLTRALPQNKRRGGNLGLEPKNQVNFPKKSSYDLTLALILKSLYEKSGNRDTFEWHDARI